MAAVCQHMGRKLCRPFSAIYSARRTLTATSVVANEKINRLLQAYEDIVGLSEVREAQEKVIKAEREFLQAQERRREKQMVMTEIQGRLRSIGLQREKSKRGEQLYLDLVTQEHNIIQEEQGLEEHMKLMEMEERDKFGFLSSAVRESHEKERARAERTKYWSLIGSVIGAAIGILGTSANNFFRMREFRAMIKDSADQGMEFHTLAAEFANTTNAQFKRLDDFLAELRSSLGSSTGKTTAQVSKFPEPSVLQQQIKEMLDIVKRQESVTESEMAQIKGLLALDKAEQSKPEVVYVGPQVDGLLKETQDNISWRINISTLATVTAIYAGIGIGIAVVSSFFKSS